MSYSFYPAYMILNLRTHFFNWVFDWTTSLTKKPVGQRVVFFSALTRGRFPALWRIQRSSVYPTLNIDICTWKPNDPCLIGKGLLLEGWTKQTGSRYFQLVVTWVSGCCHRMSKWNKATGIIFQFLSSPTLLNVWYIIWYAWYAYIWGIWGRVPA